MVEGGPERVVGRPALTPVIDEILPAAVAVSEAFADDPAAFLFPEEEAAIARAVPGRRREFATTRLCARRALAELGRPPAPLLRGARGAPAWPAGVVGSMTHCEGYRAAAVARRGDFAALGIDAEPHRPLPAHVLEAVAVPAEQARHRVLSAAAPWACWDRVLFCAKEAVYKAWFPRTGLPLEFGEADIALRTDGSLSVRVRRRHPSPEHFTPLAYEGRWVATSALVVAAVAEPATVPSTAAGPVRAADR
ncbi:4'-phosphopantetheinyl transferase [Streptomyces sp. NPDC057705]|uniref:4'-phosphopantetheinyl transferase family protein n=1 Tax=Streptomyces sp. NPDC057705 TaxID=3346222 RepID=UPI0036A07AB6